MTTKKVFFIFLLLVPTLVHAQERKMYKGSYDFARQHGDVEYEYIEGIDNEKGWITSEATSNGTVKFQTVNSIDFRSPCIFYQSDGLIIGLDNEKDFYIAQRKDNKTKKAQKIQLVSSGAKLKKGIYYKIERSSDRYTDLADFLKTITLEEVNTPTRTRIEKELSKK